MLIAVVSESAFLRTSIRVNLAPRNQVVEVRPDSLLEVLEALRLAPPGLVVVDLDIEEGCSGETLVRAIREDPVLHSTALVLLVSHAKDGVIGRMRHWGFIDVILKPFHTEALATLVETCFPQAI